MLNANYTSENICRALGMEGFANDWRLAKSDEAVRVMLMPSSHGEVCVTFIRSGYDISLIVEAAVTQIWGQDWPTPRPTPAYTASGKCDLADFETLVAMLQSAASPAVAPTFFVIDGMGVHSVLRRAKQGLVNLNKNAGYCSAYALFAAETIRIAWHAVDVPEVRNALRAAGEYVKVHLPEQAVQASKPVVRTVVLGPDDVSKALLDNLKNLHKD